MTRIQSQTSTYTMELWPTRVMCLEMDPASAGLHNPELIRLVMAGCARQQARVVRELRLYEFEEVNHAAVRWLVAEVRQAAAHYAGFITTDDIRVTLRGVQINHGQHINTHTEARESDLAVAYWPSGNPDKVSTSVSENGDEWAPTFVLEDPSRHLSDLRLPFETRHSVNICPRPGLMAIYPAHLPHNFHPHQGTVPIIHIVAQVRFPWPKDNFRS